MILDSSSDELDDRLKPHLDYKNVSYKKFPSSTFFVNKIADGSSLINTPYIVLCADDDFLIPSSIIESRNFLKKNKDFSSAHGFHFCHTNAEDAEKYGFSIAQLYKNGSSSEQDSSVNRLKSYLSGQTCYYPMYAVHRERVFKKIWMETKTYVNDWGLSELFPCALSFIIGKMKILPIFYSSREPNTFTWYDQNRHQEMFSKKKVDKAVEGLAKHINLASGAQEKHSKQVVESAFQSYLKGGSADFLSEQNELKLIWWRFKQKVRLRSRIRKMLWQGCHPSIYPEYISDYLNVKEAVLSADLSKEELNFSRKDYSHM